MRKISSIFLYPLFLLGLVFIITNSCKKDSDTPEDTPVNWSFGETASYEITPGAVISDPISGYDFGFGDETAVGTIKVSKIISGAEAPFTGNGYKIEYTGNEVLYVNIKCAAGNRVLGMIYAYPDGLFNGTLTEDWIGMPDMGTGYDSTEYYFSLTQPYDLGPLKADGKKRGSNLFWFSEIAKSSTEAGKISAIGLQSWSFLQDDYFAALNPVLKITAINAYDAKLPSYAYGKENYYQAFWRPLGLLGGYIYHPTINFKFNANEPTAEDIAHETAHYFINLIVGNEVQKVLSGQGGFFDNHGFNEIVGRDNLVEELAYFAETAAGYKTNELSEPSNSFGNNLRASVDYPGIEGFGATILYSLVRTQATIRDVNVKTRILDFPVIGLTYAQVFDIIAMGATTVNELRSKIEDYLAQIGTATQHARFPVVLQRIGWSYSVKGTLIDSATSQPLAGYAVENICKGDGGIEYNNGEMPRPIDETLTDGTFTLFRNVFPGSSILRFSKDGKSYDVPVNCPYSTLTSTEINVPTIKLNTSAFAIGQSYGGGIIFYIDNTGQHGLIAAPTDQGSFPWGCIGTSIGSTSLDMGSGLSNTIAIVNSCDESGIAAKICFDLTLNGYDDWYLPSKIELMLMSSINTFGGPIAETIYWSSSEEPDNLSDLACVNVFEGGPWAGHYSWKSDSFLVRAVRSF